MPDSVALTAVLASGERDKAPAFMLADELMESDGLPRLAALKEAARLRRAARNAREMAEARRLGGTDTEARWVIEHCLTDAILGTTPEATEPFVWHFVAGSRPPRFRVGLRYPRDLDSRCVHCTVGARWFIKTVAAMVTDPVIGLDLPRAVRVRVATDALREVI